MESVLDQKVREYKAILDRKDELAEQTKANNAAKEQLEQEICQLMVDEENRVPLLTALLTACSRQRCIPRSQRKHWPKPVSYSLMFLESRA